MLFKYGHKQELIHDHINIYVDDAQFYLKYLK